MHPSSIESLEPRWAPAKLVAGPLPVEFGADLSDYDYTPELSVILHVKEVKPQNLSPALQVSVEWYHRDPAAASNWIQSLGYRQEIARPADRVAYAQYFEMLASEGSTGGASLEVSSATSRLNAEQERALRDAFASRLSSSSTLLSRSTDAR